MRFQLWMFAILVAVIAVTARPSIAQQTVSCSSDDGNRHNCAANTSGGVQMTNQHSDARCQQGYSWGYNRRGIWVDHGCRADFLVNTGYNGGGYNGGGYNNGAPQTIACGSDDGKRHYCNANTSGSVQMTNQHSDARCQQGYSWGYDQRGVWVDHGCRADFLVNTGYGYNGGNGYNGGQGFNNGGGQAITCASDDGNRHYCAANTSGGVQMTTQRSDARCQQGYSWGYDQRGVWVDHGCRADFLVNTGYNGGGFNGGGYNNGGGQAVTCASDDGNRHYCAANTRHGVQMVNKRSDARCDQGYSWGYDQRGIWVDHGCRADFVTR